MTTVIEFYDKDVIKNILGVLSYKPDKVVYIYDSELRDMNRFVSLEKCFKKYFPEIQVEKRSVNILSVNDIIDTTGDVLKENENCIVDLTGGSELMIIGGYRAACENNAKLIYVDIIKGQILDIKTGKEVLKTATMTLEDFVDARGAQFIGTSHDEPVEEEFDRILTMCRYLFTHLNKWKKTCTFLQVAMSNSSSGEVDLRIRSEIKQKDGRRLSPYEETLFEFQKNGFIKDLYFSGKYVVFTFCSKRYKSYMINYGVWLEMYVYIHAKRTKMFQDVKLGTMIDWDAYDGKIVAGNEIDVILQDGSMPVFISCKLRAADTAALNELTIAKKRLGGWFSKSVIVCFGEDKTLKNGTYNRARELGIEMLDKSDVLSNNFGERLVNAIKSHDLVNLKWKKI